MEIVQVFFRIRWILLGFLIVLVCLIHPFHSIVKLNLKKEQKVLLRSIGREAIFSRVVLPSNHTYFYRPFEFCCFIMSVHGVQNLLAWILGHSLRSHL